MSTRRLPRERGDAGFTLIELLVVMIIIGILAAIAIPVFLNQRKKAADAAIRTDLRTMALAEEQHYADAETYLPIASFTSAPVVDEALHLSKGVSVAVTLNAVGNAFCLRGRSSTATHDWVWLSSGGGQQTSSTTVCPATF